MARTATTRAQTHKGEWLSIALDDVPLLEQKKSFLALRADRSHPEFKTVIYQESDGVVQTLRFVTPHEKQKHEEAKAAAIAEQEEFNRTNDPKLKFQNDRAKAAAEFKANEEKAKAEEAEADRKRAAEKAAAEFKANPPEVTADKPKKTK